MSPIAFTDLKAQQERIRPQLDAAIAGVLDHGRYIMGPEIGELEAKLADFTGAKHAIACSSGTDAIVLALMAKGVGIGDVVFIPAFTFVAAAEAVAFLGGIPFFVDVLSDSFNMDPASLKLAIADARKADLQMRGIVAVDLFGQPADYPAIGAIAAEEGLFLIADAAQSLGATLDGRKVGTLCELTTTSFFPAKPLGCYGDGGAIFTDDDQLASVMRSLVIHGKGDHKYDNVRVGLNARMDTLQAAILLEKLTIFPGELDARKRVADVYQSGLHGAVKTPKIAAGNTSSYAQYTIIHERRGAIEQSCKSADVPTAIYYPITLPDQKAYNHFPIVSGGVLVSDQLSKTVISLPMHPYLSEPDQAHIMSTVRNSAGANDD